MENSKERIQETISILKNTLEMVNSEMSKIGDIAYSSKSIYLLTYKINLESQITKLERLLKPEVSFIELKTLLENDEFFKPFKIVEKGSYFLVKKGNTIIAKIQLVSSHNAFLELKEGLNTLYYTNELIDFLKSKVEFSRKYGNPNY